MARATGTPNRKTPERRAELIKRMRARLHDRAQGPPSWRDLASAAGVSLSSLTHHFGRRDDVIRAILEHDHVAGAEPLRVMAAPTGDFGPSIRDAIQHLADGLTYAGLDAMFASGLAEGFGNPVLGPTFVSSLLEPTLGAVETRLQAHVDRGEMRGDDVRLAAVSLVAPVLVAALHQGPLGGRQVRPLALEAFCAGHADAFVRAWSVSPITDTSGVKATA